MIKNGKSLITKILSRNTLNNNRKNIKNLIYIPAFRKIDKRIRTNNNYDKIVIINVVFFSVASKQIGIRLFAIFIKQID